MKNRVPLTRRQLHVLPFLMNNPTIETVSKLSGVSAKQIFDWLNHPPFRQELERRNNDRGQACKFASLSQWIY
jgi:hypothetical protein